MGKFVRWYGANPLHLLALLGSFALAGYAAQRLLSDRPIAVAVWFVGAAVGHDLVLLPLYQLADRPLHQIWRRTPERTGAPWINYLRFPLAISALLLLVWFPSIFRLSKVYTSTTDLSASPYLGHWLAITGTLFLISATAYAVRLRRDHRRSTRTLKTANLETSSLPKNGPT
jgi:hypothetical protein